jgi:lactate dehydrogenase-like 2-hydroxyacid dehydrogenase
MADPRFRVYITDHDYSDIAIEKEILEPIGAEVVGLQDRTGRHLGELAGNADALLQQYAAINADTIAQLSRCRVIARYGIGLDIVDVEAATDAGIIVTNVPDYCIEEVADHSIAMALRSSGHSRCDVPAPQQDSIPHCPSYAAHIRPHLTLTTTLPLARPFST